MDLEAMARKLRVEYPGAIYHVMNRGDRREAVFRDDADRQRFLATLGDTCVKTRWQVLAVCLMPNHFHLVVETPDANLVAGMKWLLGTYTNRFNRRHQLVGHLFSGRYKALLVEGSGGGYLKTVCDYVHLNPSRAALIPPEAPLRSYPWSSWPEYLKRTGQRWPWLGVERLLGEYGVPKESAAGRHHLERELEARRRAESGADYRAIRRGWYFGEEAFRKELIERMGQRVGAEHYGEVRRESAVQRAEELIRTELARLGWPEAELARRRKGDRAKVALAARLRAETTMTVKWIAARLAMGTAAHLNNRLYLWRKGLLAPAE
jgi:REP element-mobilizing transposase RayT